MASNKIDKPMLSRLDMKILIHHSYSSMPISSENAYQNLIELELLELILDANMVISGAVLTRRGEYLVKYWQNVPLPVLTQEWVIPK